MLPDQRLESRVAAHQQAAIVEQHHAHRAEVEPVVQLAGRAVGTFARHVLGGRVLHHHQQQGAALRIGDPAPRGSVPALMAAGVEQAALEQRAGVGERGVGEEGLARLQAAGAVFGRLQLERVAPDQPVARVAGELEIGRVHVDEPEGSILQRGGERCVPDEPEGLVHRVHRLGRRRRRGRGQQAQHRFSRIEPAPGQREGAAVGQARQRRLGGTRLTALRGLQPGHGRRAEQRFEPGQRQAHGIGHEPRRGAVGKTDQAGGVEQQHGLAEAVEQGVPGRQWQPGLGADRAPQCHGGGRLIRAGSPPSARAAARG